MKSIDNNTERIVNHKEEKGFQRGIILRGRKIGVS